MPNPVGRPTKYTPELVKQAHEYVENYETHGHAIPSHGGLSLVLGITRTALYDWAKHEDKKEFSYILGVIMTTQELVLLNKGLMGEFNSNITKLALGKHGYHDKRDESLDLKGKIEVTNKTLQVAGHGPEDKHPE